MKHPWIQRLAVDPLPALLTSRNIAIKYFAERDLLKKKGEPVSTLWTLPEVLRLVKKQREGGYWDYPSKGMMRSATNYNQLETYRNLGELVEKYGLDSGHDAVLSAARFLFSCQSAKGDFRGIYGNQYSPNYSAGIMEVLIKAGFGRDPRIKKGFDWLLTVRQEDGGWAIPLRTRGAKYNLAVLDGTTLEPDRSKPFSHLVTGVVLRAFAAHPDYRKSEAALTGGKLLASRFFKADRYSDRRTPEYWVKCSFPFWFTDIVSSLDSLSVMSWPSEEPEIREALKWLKDRQNPDGLFRLKLLKIKDKDLDRWLCLAVCRSFERFYA